MTAEGAINFESPVISRFSIEGIPYYFAVDGDGTLLGQGDLGSVISAIGQ